MRYYRYWAKANSTRLGPNNFPVRAWGYSNESQADAEQLALQRADMKISELAQRPSAQEAYGYGLDALPEQLIEELSLNEQVVAIILHTKPGLDKVTPLVVPRDQGSQAKLLREIGNGQLCSHNAIIKFLEGINAIAILVD